jgi:exopolyphosphatase/guanosine-5'-triphosphate,3'-diphosphate pyrophosphatase
LSLPLGVHRAKSKNNKIIDKFKSSLQNTEWLNENKFKRVILTGGTWRALVKLYFDKYNYPLKVIHHFKPDFDNFVLMLEEVSNFKKKDLLQYSLITKDKTPFIRYAAKLALEIINKVSAKQVVISYTAIREGYISDKIKLNYKNDPLEYQSLKVAAIANELNSRAVNFENIKLFTNNFFKKRSYLNKRIRESAVNYISTGESVARDERGLFIFKQIIKSEILKFSHSDRVMLATIIFVFHNGINYNEIKDYRKIINKNKLLSSIELGLFLRIVYEIGQLSNFNYSNISIYVKDSNLIFSIPKNYSELLNSRFNKFILMLSKHKKLSQKIIFV